jgi:hypothetical protein
MRIDELLSHQGLHATGCANDNCSRVNAIEASMSAVQAGITYA